MCLAFGKGRSAVTVKCTYFRYRRASKIFSQCLTPLQPYIKELEGPPEEADAPSIQGDYAAGMNEDGKRRGRGRNTNWCHNCSAMGRDMGCLCCGESPAAVERAADKPCFLQPPSFEALCLNKDNLTVALTSRLSALLEVLPWYKIMDYFALSIQISSVGSIFSIHSMGAWFSWMR